MPRKKGEHPTQVMSARIPWELAEPTRREAKELGQRISERIREGLRAILGKGSSGFEKQAVKELLKAAEGHNVAAVAEVAGELLKAAENKAEERFVEQTATQVADTLSAMLQKTAREAKAAKVVKGPAAKAFKDTLKGRDIAAAFRAAKGKVEVGLLSAKFREDAASPREEMFIESEAKRAIKAAERALEKQKKALAKAAPKSRPAKVAKKEEEAPLIAKAPPGKVRADIFYQTSGKNPRTKEIIVYVSPSAGVKQILEEGVKVSGLKLFARGGHGPFEIQTDNGVYKRKGGLGFIKYDTGEPWPDIEFKTWEKLEEEEKREAREGKGSWPPITWKSSEKTEPKPAKAKKEALPGKDRTVEYYKEAMIQFNDGFLPSTQEKVLAAVAEIRKQGLTLTSAERKNLTQAKLEELRRLRKLGKVGSHDEITYKQLLAARSIPELDRIKENLLKAAKQEPDKRRIIVEARYLQKYGKLVEKEKSRQSAKQKEILKAECEGEACTYSVEGGTCTIKAPLTIGGKEGGTEKIPARYCLVEADELKTSNQPTRSYSPTPGYPREAQERDYEREKNEQLKVQQIADNMDFELIFNNAPGSMDGLPIVNEDGFVLGGNGRTMAIKLVYAGLAKTKPEDLKRAVEQSRLSMGFYPDQIKRFKHPMIVRTIRTGKEPRELARWSRRLNQSLSEQLSPTLIAVSRARFLDPSALDELRALPDDETLAGWLNTNSSRGFVRELQRSGAIDQRTAPTFLLPSGLLSPEGRDLVNDLLVAVLVPDAQLIKQLGPGPVATLAKAAPYLAQQKALGRYDLLPQFTLALRDFATMRAQNLHNPAELWRQGGMFGVSSLTRGAPLPELWLEILSQLGSSPAKLAKLARRYVVLAKGPAAGQFSLIAEEHLEPLPALQRAASEAGVKL